MGENLFCSGLHRVSDEYRDGWTRIKIGHPAMSLEVWELIEEWLDSGNISACILFFTEKCEFDTEYTGFLIREFLRGNIDKPKKRSVEQ